MSSEISCTACGKRSMVRREPVYEGFRKVSEIVICVSCGQRYAKQNTIPWAEKMGGLALFSDADKAQAPQIFKAEERGNSCRHCMHFVVNPFTERCGLHNRRVAATDICDDFVAAENSRK